MRSGGRAAVRLGVRALGEPFNGVLADWLEHRQAGLVVGARATSEHALGDQPLDDLEARAGHLVGGMGRTRRRTRTAGRTPRARIRRAVGSSSRALPEAFAGGSGLAAPPQGGQDASSRAPSSRGESTPSAPAASSIASGRPPSARHTVAIASASPALSRKDGSRAPARAMNERSRAPPPPSAGSADPAAPAARADSAARRAGQRARLVTSNAHRGAASSSSASSGAAASRCSKLSSTSSSVARRRGGAASPARPAPAVPPSARRRRPRRRRDLRAGRGRRTLRRRGVRRLVRRRNRQASLADAADPDHIDQPHVLTAKQRDDATSRAAIAAGQARRRRRRTRGGGAVPPRRADSSDVDCSEDLGLQPLAAPGPAPSPSSVGQVRARALVGVQGSAWRSPRYSASISCPASRSRRVRGDQRLELADQGRVPAEARSASTRSSSARPDVPPGAISGAAADGSTARSASARAAPQRERLARIRPRPAGVPRLKRLRRRDARLEPQRLARRVRPRARSPPRPRLQDVRVCRAPCAGARRARAGAGFVRRRPPLDSSSSQTIRRHHLVGVQRQQREQAPLLGFCQAQWPARVVHLERAEDPELHADK